MLREWVRRLLLIVGVLSGIWLYLDAPSGIVRVRGIDFEEEYRSYHLRRPGVGALEQGQALIRDTRAGETLDQFIARQTKGRLVTVEETLWLSFFDRIAASPGAAQFIPVTAPPLNTLRGELREMGDFRYVRLPHRGKDRYISVNLKAPDEARRMGADAGVVYPARRWSLWFALGGIALYIAIPRMKRLPGAIGFGRVSGVYLPDLLGTLLIAVFFTLPLLIVPNFCDCTTRQLFQEDRYWFFVFFWPFCIGGFFVYKYSALYASFQIVIESDRLRWITPGRIEDIPFDRIASLKPVDQRMPRWLTTLAMFVALANPRGAMHAAHLRRYHRAGIDLFRRDGWRLRIWQDMPGFDRIIDALQAAHVPMPDLPADLLQPAEEAEEPS